MKALISIIILYTFLTSMTFASNQMMDETQFTNYFIQRAKKDLVKNQFEIVAPLTVKVKSIDHTDKEVTSFLDNLFKQYKNDPQALDTLLDSFIYNLTGHELLYEESIQLSSVLGVIKPVEYVLSIQKQLSQAKNEDVEKIDLLKRRINDDLYLLYVFDTEKGVRFLTTKDLKDLKLDENTLYEKTISNLEKYFKIKGLVFDEIDVNGPSKLYKISLDEMYDASILILPSYLDKKKYDVNGEPIFFAPNRNVVLVVGSNDVYGLRIAKHIAWQAFNEMGYSITPKAYIYKKGSLQEYLIP
ncbi:MULTISPECIES: DUF1444 family protein [Acinetobacter]|nr:MULTISPECIES: DUF1444 family protein [Acinetobacter]EEH68177.1 hypothetical protein HMPREF0023_2282 [Acinetobacter sp. ATCC 27244]MCU4388636.1 DUF1444 family protein [Acinetobacter haemolyticus]WPO66643.1 DUF1444 family protein [Acinetobacter haemolyticus]